MAALSERLSANFATHLGTTTVGRGLVTAKQEYAASLYTITPYDLKVLEEFTDHRAPMFSVGAGCPLHRPRSHWRRPPG